MSRSSAVIALALAVDCRPGADLSTLEAFDALEPGSFTPARLLVGLAGDLPERLRVGEVGLLRARAWEELDAAVYDVPEQSDLALVAAWLAQDPDVLWVEPDYLRTASVNDPYYTFQWNLAAIDAAGAWAYGTGAGVVVAVLDTGLSTVGEDTPASVAGWDFVDDDADPTDLNGHGTHVAGTVAQATDNALGVAGVAAGASVMPVRVLDAAGSGTTADVVDGILYAANNGAEVLNLSLGSRYSSTTESSAVTYAWGLGATIVAAAGNARQRSVDYPARYTESLAVGATDYRNALATYSNKGTGLDFVAPGGNTSRDDNGDGYADGILQETFDPTWGYYFWQGTSMAAPHVAGVAAILAGLGATNAEIESALRSTVVDLGSAGYDSTFGYGLIDAAAAAAAIASPPPPDTTPPVISGVSHTWKSRSLKVSFATDEPATGQVCDSAGVCGTSALGTSHSISIRATGTTYTITATDAAGNAATSGPHSF